MLTSLALLQQFARNVSLPDRKHIKVRAGLFTLAILFCWWPQVARADDRCMEPGYLEHFNPRLTTPEPCDEITSAEIHWRGGTALLRAIHPRSMPIGDDSDLVGRIRATADAVGHAMESMGGDLHLDNVTLLLTNYVSPREGTPEEGFDKGSYIAAASTVFAHECPVSYYKLRVRTSGDSFTFTLAHEVFHCVQYRTWPSMPDEGWLTEASAEYFAYLAKPDYRAGFIPAFDRNIPNTALNRMDYPAVVFYLWLGNAYGPPRVREFLASTRSIESAIDPDMLTKFAQAYFTQTIRMPEGLPLPSTPATGATRTINASTRILSPEVTPYTLNQETLTFSRGKVYQLTLSTEPLDARTVWRREPGGFAFDQAPRSISTCDDEQRYRVIRTTTRSSRAGDIEITAEPATAAACSCPAGTWQETPASTRHTFESSATGGRVRYIAGSRLLTLNPDHTGSFIYNSVETESEPGGDFSVNVTRTGGTHFTWKTVNGTLLTVLVPGDNLLTLHNSYHARGGGSGFETRRAAPQSIGHGFFCDASGLHLRQLRPATFALIDVNMDFARVGAPPEPGPTPQP